MGSTHNDYGMGNGGAGSWGWSGVCWEDQEGWVKTEAFRSREVRLEMEEERAQKKTVRRFNLRPRRKICSWGWMNFQANQRTCPSHDLLTWTFEGTSSVEAQVSALKAWGGSRTKTRSPQRPDLLGPSILMRVLRLMQPSAFHRY